MPGPLNESKDDADLHDEWGKYAMFYASQFIPWDFESPIIDATNEKESWLEAWTAHIETLQTQACFRLSDTSGRRPCNNGNLQK